MMKKLTVLLAAVFLVLGLSGTSMAVEVFNGSEYMDISKVLSWVDAKTEAEGLGPGGWHLVTITSKEEQEFLAGWLGSRNGLLWAGGYQALAPEQKPADGWSWVTGEPWSYTAWATAYTTEPNDWNGANEIYLALDGRIIEGSPRNWTWNDGLTTEGIIGYVVERSTPVPIPGALVLFGSGLVGLVGIGRRRMKK